MHPDAVRELIEEQTAELRAEVERLRADAASAWEEVSRVQQVGLRAESRLAAATELLRRCQQGVSLVSLLGRDLDTFLAAQPAATTRTEAEQRVEKDRNG